MQSLNLPPLSVEQSKRLT